MSWASSSQGLVGVSDTFYRNSETVIHISTGGHGVEIRERKLEGGWTYLQGVHPWQRGNLVRYTLSPNSLS